MERPAMLWYKIDKSRDKLMIYFKSWLDAKTSS